MGRTWLPSKPKTEAVSLPPNPSHSSSQDIPRPDVSDFLLFPSICFRNHCHAASSSHWVCSFFFYSIFFVCPSVLCSLRIGGLLAFDTPIVPVIPSHNLRTARDPECSEPHRLPLFSSPSTAAFYQACLLLASFIHYWIATFGLFLPSNYVIAVSWRQVPALKSANWYVYCFVSLLTLVLGLALKAIPTRIGSWDYPFSLQSFLSHAGS